MSDEQQQSEQRQTQQPSTCPHPEAVGKRWGDLISEERQRELQGYLDRWTQEGDHGERKGPFDFTGRSDEVHERLHLTGADVSWLAEQKGYDKFGWVPALHLEAASLNGAHLEQADLTGAHLEQAHLNGAHLAE